MATQGPRLAMLTAVAFIAAIMLSATAAAADLGARFPDPRQVIGDYPDEVQRYVALEALEHELNRDVPRPQSRATYQKNFAYGAAYNAIENEHMMKGMRSLDYRQWAQARDALLNDVGFRRSVLARYAVAGLPPLGQSTPPDDGGKPRAQGPAPLTDQQILRRAFYRALPVTLPCFVLMFALPWLMINNSGIRQAPSSLKPNPDPKLPPLPEELRVIRLPAVHYPIDTASGVILDIKTTHIARTTYYLATQTPTAGPYAGQPVPTSHTELVRSDHLRVRTTHNGEAVWTLLGGGMEVFTGQTLSVVFRQRKDLNFDILLVYNHNTGALSAQIEQLTDAHRARGLFSQTVGFFAGVLPCTALAAMAVASGIENLINVSMEFFEVMMVPGSICSLTIAFFWTRWLKYEVPRRRTRRLLAKYGPGFSRYFAQCTPALQALFGR
jgi:hypothetical protein